MHWILRLAIIATALGVVVQLALESGCATATSEKVRSFLRPVTAAMPRWVISSFNYFRAYLCKYMVCPSFNGEWVEMSHIETRSKGDHAGASLYLGSIRDASNLTLLQRMNITHVVTVVAGVPALYPQHAKYHLIAVHDTPTEPDSLLPHFDGAVQFIEQALSNGHSVLVHCIQGRSRSSSIIIAHQMHVHGLSLDEAYSRVRERRSIVCPNSGFLSQLSAYEKRK